jgi:Bacterial Ig-like domain (group 3)
MALTVTPSSTTCGQSVSLTATIAVVAPGAGSPTGSVEFFDGSSELGTASTSGNSAILSTTSLTAGAHSLSAQCLGDGNFIGSASPVVSQNVGQASTTMTLAASPATSVFGQSVTFTASVTADAPGAGIPTGTISFMEGSNTLDGVTLGSSTTVSFSTTALAVGSATIMAVYSGDDDFLTSSSSTKLTIN